MIEFKLRILDRLSGVLAFKFLKMTYHAARNKVEKALNVCCLKRHLSLKDRIYITEKAISIVKSQRLTQSYKTKNIDTLFIALKT